MAQAETKEHRHPAPSLQYAEAPIADAEGRVRLRTLTTIRWIAIAGQLAALFVVRFGLNWTLPMDEALVVVGASVILNVAMTFRRPEQGRLKEWEAAAYLAFDTVQLGVLLYLTGGLTNPFALLLLGPVAVSATALTRRATAVLCALVIVCATALVYDHMLLPWSDVGLRLPRLYVWGLWASVIIGTLFLAGYAGSLAAESRRMSSALAATREALAREQQVSAVGGLAAAAAHELGSPLATILVAATELSREIPENSPYAEEVKMLREEAVRCRDILAELARKPVADGRDDPFAQSPLSALVRTIADRHSAAGIAIDVATGSDDGSAEPVVANSPEINHGLGNIIQNAVQFARAVVDIRIVWDRRTVAVTVRDDGPGFAPAVLDRVGEPYISSRSENHLGLGIFIARALLQRTEGRLTVRNLRGIGGRVQGGEVVITWPRTSLDVRAAAR